MTPERCIEHVRHPVSMRSGTKITSVKSDHSLCLVARLLYLLVLQGIINERAEGTRRKNNETHTHIHTKKNYNMADPRIARFIDLTTT